MSGPMPTHFRWLWYLVGLAGMALSVIGILAILGSAAELGIVVPLVVGGAIVIGYVLIRFRRSLHAAVAAAPSRQPGATPLSDAPPPASALEPGTPQPSTPLPASATPASETSTPGAATIGAAGVPNVPSAPDPGSKKPPAGPPRTSRR